MSFRYSLDYLKKNWKPLKNQYKQKEKNETNEIVSMSWYRNMVKDLCKRANLFSSNDIIYRFGVRIKFRNFISIKYKPYPLARGEIPINREDIKPLDNVMKNFARCGWCKKHINLKNKNEYTRVDDGVLCSFCWVDTDDN